ncbi:MAG: pyridoxal phosphate-dependent aminotransferase [Bacteroidales bacterium]|nr:pyridoxal phosphate-dependent aminotransferase [Bacteroidales bacterium]
MKDTPIDHEVVSRLIEESRISNIGKASIREIKRLVDNIEKETGKKFIRMEMGIPGLPPNSIGVKAEIEALKSGVASVYPDIEGIFQLKKEIQKFVKLFLDTDINSDNCVPTAGSMQASLASFITLSRMQENKDTVLFIDPGFPVHKQQCRIFGIKYESFDIFNFRGEKLKEKLESYLKKGNFISILYSNPNNPSWICFTESELKIIGDLANKYDVTVLEDLAYFGMDFRKDYSKPGVPPHQPTIAKYTDNYILFISGSKLFSYAGQRIGMMVISDKLFNKQAAGLKRHYTTDIFGRAMIYGTLYASTAGTAHSVQYAMTAILKAANDGKFVITDEVKEYGKKAKIMKKLFIDNGFKIVYDKDIDLPLADGFYFTFSYLGMSGEELLKELLFFGISAISLSITGSEREEGMRACVSLVPRDQLPELECRLKKFKELHS